LSSTFPGEETKTLIPFANRIDATFDELRNKKEKALVVYITGGDPDISTTLKLLHALTEAGADLIEIGIPFSDPMGDGKANQKAAERALRKNTNLKNIFDCVRRFRKTNRTTPLVFFSYLNPVYSFGYERFSVECRKSGIDGCLFLDMPFDEEASLQRSLLKNRIHTILLATPATESRRLKNICRKTGGFLYAVSSLGVTGMRTHFDRGFKSYIKKIRAHCTQPVCVGFGISTPEMAQKASLEADGVIIGSAIVNLIEKNLNNKRKILSEISYFTKKVKESLSKLLQKE
jgi:tryptophan synthase alpha chain